MSFKDEPTNVWLENTWNNGKIMWILLKLWSVWPKQTDMKQRSGKYKIHSQLAKTARSLSGLGLDSVQTSCRLWLSLTPVWAVVRYSGGTVLRRIEFQMGSRSSRWFTCNSLVFRTFLVNNSGICLSVELFFLFSLSHLNFYNEWAQNLTFFLGLLTSSWFSGDLLSKTCEAMLFVTLCQQLLSNFYISNLCECAGQKRREVHGAQLWKKLEHDWSHLLFSSSAHLVPSVSLAWRLEDGFPHHSEVSGSQPHWFYWWLLTYGVHTGAVQSLRVRRKSWTTKTSYNHTVVF